MRTGAEIFRSRVYIISSPDFQIDASIRYADGIDVILKQPDIDIVVVDLFLDNNHTAIEFIGAARAAGAQCQFVIATNATKSYLLSAERGDLFNEIINSQAIKFFEKNEINSFRLFKQKITQAFEQASSRMGDEIQRINKINNDTLLQIEKLSSELYLYSKIISSYQQKIKSELFARLCSLSLDRLEKIKHSSSMEHRQSSSFRHDDLAQSSAARLPPSSTQFDCSLTPKSKDLIPCSPNQKLLIDTLSRFTKKLRREFIQRASYEFEFKQLVTSFSSCSDDLPIESVFVALAGEIFPKSIELRVDFLEYISRHFDRNGMQEKSIGLLVVISLMLLEDNRLEESSQYLIAAKRKTIASGKDYMLNNIRDIHPLEHQRFMDKD